MIRTVTLRFRKPEPGTTQIPDKTEIKRRLEFIDDSRGLEYLYDLIAAQEKKIFTAGGLVLLFGRAIAEYARRMSLGREDVRALHHNVPMWILMLSGEEEGDKVVQEAAARYMTALHNPLSIIPEPRPSQIA